MGYGLLLNQHRKCFFKLNISLESPPLKLVYKKLIFPSIISKSISDSIVVSQYNIMLLEAELEPVDHISKSVLYSIINLYVRVRSFSLAKDIITCHTSPEIEDILLPYSLVSGVCYIAVG